MKEGTRAKAWVCVRGTTSVLAKDLSDGSCCVGVDGDGGWEVFCVGDTISEGKRGWVEERSVKRRRRRSYHEQTWLDYLTNPLLSSHPPDENNATTRNTRPGHFPSPHTFVGLLWRVVALVIPRTRQRPSVPILVIPARQLLRVDLNDGHIHGRRISNPIS